MDWHPKNVMLTALFLATKTTNNPISLETYTTHIPNTVPSDVLDLEFLVAQSLRFEFSNLTPTSDTKSLYESALTHIRASRLTDAELIYAPSQIALAAFGLVAPDLATQWSILKLRPNSTTPNLTVDTLSDQTNTLKNLIASYGHPPEIEAVREVDRRLKLCKNPEKIVGSHAYLVKKGEEEKKAEERRHKKASEMPLEGKDPFEQSTKAPAGLVDYDDDDDD
ncbi:hypothetical protein H0H93_002833 [Arthromyces matolae]|nr:hypothetical protein H0H93_002833 [Arthromyces matolae]